MDVDSLLHRIRFDGRPEVSVATLARLQAAFLLSVPFENLDIHLGRPISLDGGDIYVKVVGNRRGGFCYECNILFHDALRQIGFAVRMVSARMATGTEVGPEFDHMALVVSLAGNEYLVDVGNGQSTRTPLRLAGDDESGAEGIRYRIGRVEGGPALMHKKPGSDWAPRFLFGTRARRADEFEGMCRYHQTSPESHFTRERFVTIAKPRGRVTLDGMCLRIDDGGTVSERVLADEDAYAGALATHFAIDRAVQTGKEGDLTIITIAVGR